MESIACITFAQQANKQTHTHIYTHKQTNKHTHSHVHTHPLASTTIGRVAVHIGSALTLSTLTADWERVAVLPACFFLRGYLRMALFVFRFFRGRAGILFAYLPAALLWPGLLSGGCCTEGLFFICRGWLTAGTERSTCNVFKTTGLTGVVALWNTGTDLYISVPEAPGTQGTMYTVN